MFGWFKPQPRRTKLWVVVTEWYFDWEMEPLTQVMVTVRRTDGDEALFPPFRGRLKWERGKGGIELELPPGEYEMCLTPRWSGHQGGCHGAAVRWRVQLAGQAEWLVPVTFEKEDDGTYSVTVTNQTLR